MPAPSPDHEPDPHPSGVGVFAESGDFATEIGEIADGDTLAMESLHELDPDQVEAPRARKGLGVLFWIAASVFGLIVLLAVLAPILPLDDPTRTVARPRLGPSTSHWFGTDNLGRDIFSRVIWAGRVSLVVGVASILLGLLVGGTVGVLAGYYRGRSETFLMGAMDVLLSFPALLLALAIITFRDNRSLTTIVLAIGVVSIAPVARLVRANTLVYSQREFVTAARSLGASNRRIIVREVLPNVIGSIIVAATLTVARAILLEAYISFLGYGIQPPLPSWGNMLNNAQQYLDSAPWLAIVPGVAITLAVTSFNFIGDGLRDALDARSVK